MDGLNNNIYLYTDLIMIYINYYPIYMYIYLLDNDAIVKSATL